jgi:hypothetical protein
MAVYTNVFVASDDEVAVPEWDGSSPEALFPTVQAKGIGPDKLVLLSALLAGESPMTIEQNPARFVSEIDSLFPLVRAFGSNPDGTGSDDVPWVFQVPESLIQQLLKLTHADVEMYTMQWVSLMWEGRRMSAESIEGYVDYLRDLQRMASSRRSEEQRLFLWVCV